jgi:hypothetical protein
MSEVTLASLFLERCLVMAPTLLLLILVVVERVDTMYGSARMRCSALQLGNRQQLQLPPSLSGINV